MDGFGVRITEHGAKSFFVMRRRRGDKRLTRISLGTYPTDAPKDDRHEAIAGARAKAKEALTELAAGRDPRDREAEQRAAEERRRQAETDREANTFREIAKLFKKLYDDKRTSKNIKSIIDRELVSRWGEMPITDITRADVVDMIEAVNRKSPSTARQARIYGVRCFDWAINRGKYGLDTSPFYGVSARDLIKKVKPRKRTLKDPEIRILWAVTDSVEGYPFDPYARLLLILGSRRGETATMRRDELDLDAGTWLIPADDAKNEEARIMPLPPMALDILTALPKQTGPHVFSTTDGKRPISGFSKYQERLHKRIKAIAPPDGIPHWSLHDLRRTMRTNLSALPIQEIVRELLIGHKKKGLSAVYDLYAYLDEKRDGMDKWVARLQGIIAAVRQRGTIAPHVNSH